MTYWVCSLQPQQEYVRRQDMMKGESTGLFPLSVRRRYRSPWILTSLADCLFAARESEGVDCQSAADGASKLDGDLILGQGAVPIISKASAAQGCERGILDELKLSGRGRRCCHDGTDVLHEALRREKRLSRLLYLIAEEFEKNVKRMYRLVRPNHAPHVMVVIHRRCRV